LKVCINKKRLRPNVREKLWIAKNPTKGLNLTFFRSHIKKCLELYCPPVVHHSPNYITRGNKSVYLIQPKARGKGVSIYLSYKEFVLLMRPSDVAVIYSHLSPISRYLSYNQVAPRSYSIPLATLLNFSQSVLYYQYTIKLYSELLLTREDLLKVIYDWHSILVLKLNVILRIYSLFTVVWS